MGKIVDNITLLPNIYKEEDIIILRATEKEEAFSDIIHIKIKLERERRKHTSILES